MEEALIRLCAVYGVRAGRICGLTGVWCGLADGRLFGREPWPQSARSAQDRRHRHPRLARHHLARLRLQRHHRPRDFRLINPAASPDRPVPASKGKSPIRPRLPSLESIAHRGRAPVRPRLRRADPGRREPRCLRAAQRPCAPQPQSRAPHGATVRLPQLAAPQVPARTRPFRSRAKSSACSTNLASTPSAPDRPRPHAVAIYNPAGPVGARHRGENDSCQPMSSCPRWASRSSRAPSPNGSRSPATGREGRAALRNLHRQSRCGNPFARGRHAHRNQIPRRRHRAGQYRGRRLRRTASSGHTRNAAGRSRPHRRVRGEGAVGPHRRCHRGGNRDQSMPQMGESIFEGTITKWLKKAGDQCRERRAALRNLHRQSRRGDSFAHGRHPHRDQSSAKAQPCRSTRGRRHRQGSLRCSSSAQTKSAQPLPRQAQPRSRIARSEAQLEAACRLLPAEPCVPRRSSAASPKKTTSIWRESPAPVRRAASPKTTSCATLAYPAAQRPLAPTQVPPKAESSHRRCRRSRGWPPRRCRSKMKSSP